MAKSIVLYGPQGSGKTYHGDAIAEAHGLITVVDLEDVMLGDERLQREGHLYLTCSVWFAERAAQRLGTPVLHIEQALACIRADKPEVARG